MSESAWGGVGRPKTDEATARRREFLRLVSAGLTCRDAARQAGMKADTVLTLLDVPEFRAVMAAILNERATDTIAA